MTASLRFRDHELFHRGALAAVAGGAIGGLALHALSTAPGSAVGIAIVTGAVLAGAALASGGVRRLVGEMTGRRFLITLGAALAIFTVARFVLVAVYGAQELAQLPAWFVAAIGGAGFGLVGAVALLPRHVYFTPDRVGDAYGSLRGGLRGELAELSQRGYDIWRRVEGSLPEGDPSRETLELAVLRLLDCARSWQSIEAGHSEAETSSLVERLSVLEERIAKTEDAVVAKQYEQARSALGEQLRYLRDINTRRERVVARMHNYLAAMEQLRLAVVNVESTNVSATIGPLLDDLEEMGQEVISTSAAL